jgi:DNA polymerase III subunit delta'
MTMHSLLALPFPWQEKQWQHLYQQHRMDRLAHALLFTGQAGLGKFLFARRFAKTLLCKPAVNTGSACDRCRDCLLVQADTHPDLACMVPEKAGKGIKIEQVRHFIQQSNHTTQSAYKIIIINPAESLLTAASNALLKSLEEPTDRTLFILITDKPGLLLPTIRSRCQFIRFHTPPASEGKTWLRQQIPELDSVDALYALADEAPLQALSYAKTEKLATYQNLLISLTQLVKKEQDPIKLAEIYLKTELATVLQCLTKIVSELIKQHFGINSQHSNLHSLASASQLSLAFLFRYFAQLIDLQQHAKIALNPQLLLEDLFCRWALQVKHE